MVKVHDKCDTHKLALAKYKGWCNSKIQGSVTTIIDSKIRVEVARNRTTLESLIRCAIYCARQDIGLRGHSETTKISEIVNNDIATKNKGNFLELVKLLCIESQTFCSAYEALQNSAKYTTSTVITQSILKEAQEGSKIFSFIVDEARDDAKLKQMSICIRYVHNSVIKERFLGFVELKELNANALSCNIKLFLNNFGLDLSNCVSKFYDGASVMSGQFNGVQKKIKDMSGNLYTYIHCYAHILNLVLVDVSRKVEEVYDTIGLLEAVYAFQSSSTVRYQVFFDKTGSKVPMHCDTHWVSKFKSIRYFKNNFALVLTELKECIESSKSKEAAEAKGLIIQVNSLKTIMLLFCLDYILPLVNILSLNLQTNTLDYSRCAKLIKSTMEQLINLRQDIGLREHSKTTVIPEIVNNDIATENKGNFLELVKLLCIESQTFCSAYKALPNNAKYTSKILQNDMISTASTVIAQSILKEVQEVSKIFSLIVDEIRDDTKLEQMSICIRYVHNSVIKERFLGFFELKELNANALSCNIKLFLNNFGQELSNSLKECTESSKSKEAAETKVNILPLNLQTTLDYSRCAKLINLKSEKIFINICNEVVSVSQTLNIEPNDTLRPTREQRISSTLDNYLTYSTLGASTSRKEKQNISSKDTENEFKSLFPDFR
ncbi:Ribonuclease H-like domain,Domain of unknown function DUF4371 [Cinara cedri]|uniref:DUF4371 domain-containing protein n=1 Tax=Cinara cedri TaxID=506608 RepID=A0A5E4N6D4_9HEMI|nr:Ribonuclease H-like domain,Domain of unknown function DUF4371 [Cinara cedri]